MILHLDTTKKIEEYVYEQACMQYMHNIICASRKDKQKGLNGECWCA